MREFKEEEVKKLSKPHENSSKEDNGQVTIIGGSSLFHGAPILALKTASRVVDMVFFASPEASVGKVAERIKSKLSSFIWVPWDHLAEYLEKSDAILIGPGFMRYHKDTNNRCDLACRETRSITEKFLKVWPKKQWVIDAGSLQTIDPLRIPQNAILTPNRKEFARLFGLRMNQENLRVMAQKYHCLIVGKGVETIVASSRESVLVKGGNAGLTKGGTGDVLAGLTVALAAKNPPFLAACASSWIVKKAADELYNKVGFAYNADDLAEKVPEVLKKYFC
ncbi:MAG: NAD(P)H-hydrate dehydratase [Patescibacteria group bacterium]